MFDDNTGIGQFTLSRCGATLPDNPQLSSVVNAEDWTLSTHSALHVTDIRTLDGKWVGWLLGLPIDTAEERVVIHCETIPLRYDQLTPGAFEHWLYKCGGRFIAIVFARSFRRLYLDAMGSLGCWYSNSRRVLGSMPERISGRLDWESAWGRRLLKSRHVSGNWYPGGFCADPDIMSLLPNHCIDLDSWEVFRHWPLPEMGAAGRRPSVQEILEESSEIIGSHITALARQFRLGLPLTGGQDCRSLLACGRKHAHEIALFVEADAGTPTFDIEVPRALSSMMNLPFQVNPRYRDWHVTLSGLGGEIARSFFWGPYWRRFPHLDSAFLMQRLQFEQCDDQVDHRLAEWKEYVPRMRPQDELDLLYLEHRLGTCFASVLYSKDAQGATAVVPMNHRRLYELFRLLPLSYRAARRFNKELIGLMWPELSYVPYNSLSFKGRERLIREIDHMFNPHITTEQKELLHPFLQDTRRFTERLKDSATFIPMKVLEEARVLKHFILP